MACQHVNIGAPAAGALEGGPGYDRDHPGVSYVSHGLILAGVKISFSGVSRMLVDRQDNIVVDGFTKIFSD